MTPVYERSNRVVVVTRYWARDMDRDLSSPAHQVLVALVVLAIEQQAVVRLQIGGLLWERSRSHVFRSGYDVENGFTEAPGDDAGVSQLSDANRDVDIFRDQIKKTVRDEQVNSDTRMIFQESGYEI